MTTCGVDEVLARHTVAVIAGHRHHRPTAIVMFRLSIVDPSPIFQGRHVHTNLHRFGPGQILPVGDDPIEQFRSKPVH